MTELIGQMKEILVPGGQWGVAVLLLLVVFGLYMIATGLGGLIWPLIIEEKSLTVEEQVQQEVDEERQALLYGTPVAAACLQNCVPGRKSPANGGRFWKDIAPTYCSYRYWQPGSPGT